MMAELKALFDELRLLPGLGMQLHGHDGKQTFEGVEATGVNGQITLQRSANGSFRSAGLQEDHELPVLRAGPGIRLHGYGGRFVVERVPEAVVEETVLRTAGLEIEQENRSMNGSICCLSTDYDTEEFIIAEQTVSNFTNGSITATVTASGVIQTFADDESVDACADWVYADDFDPEFDYGDYVGGDYSTTRVPFSDLLDAVSAALAAMTPEASTYAVTWPESTWQAISQSGGWSIGLSPVSSIAVSISDPVGNADTLRWRVTNTGQCVWLLDWELREYYSSTLVESGTIELSPGETSDWVEPPSLTSTLLVYSLSRIRLGRWRFGS